MTTAHWRPGDRVELRPDGRQLKAGTVISVDVEGVDVRLDHPVFGVDECYATANELHRRDLAAVEARGGI